MSFDQHRIKENTKNCISARSVSAKDLLKSISSYKSDAEKTIAVKTRQVG